MPKFFKDHVNKIALLLAILFPSAAAFADTLLLKSGMAVEGPVIEKTGKYIKLDVDGTPLTYYFDEIDAINGKPPSPSAVQSYQKPGQTAALPGPDNSTPPQEGLSQQGPPQETVPKKTYAPYTQTIILKSGMAVEGIITDRTDKYITVNTQGLSTIICYLSDIESIDGQPVDQSYQKPDQHNIEGIHPNDVPADEP